MRSNGISQNSIVASAVDMSQDPLIESIQTEFLRIMLARAIGRVVVSKIFAGHRLQLVGS